MLGTLTIGTTNLTTAYRVYATDAPVYNAPEPDVKPISIQGRDGDLLVDNKRYKNISVKYPCVIPAASGNQTSFASCIAGLRAFLLSNRGYVKITHSFDTSEYRLGRYVGGLEVDPTVTGDAATFTLTFDCKPQRWLVSGDTVQSFTGSSGTINNPTLFDALPKITVYGSGSGTVTINGRQVTISAIDSSVVLDSEMQDAYKGSTNKNNTVTLNSGGYPYLSAGNNSITRTGGVTRVEVIPKWWTL